MHRGGGTLQNKIGFTLIELLAVIVILAVIALIATPIVLNIIKEAKKNSTEASMKMIEHAAEIYYYDNSLSEKREEITFICSNGKCSSKDKVLKLEGKVPELGIIKIDKNGKVTLKSILMNGYSCIKKNGSYKCEKADNRIIETQENMIHINDNKLIHVTDYKIYGNSVVESETEQISEVGDLVTDTTSKYYGKYEIKIKVVGKNLFDNRLPYKDLKTKITNRQELIEGLNSGQRIFYGIEHISGKDYEITYNSNNVIFVVLPINNNMSYFVNEYSRELIGFLNENFIYSHTSSRNFFENTVGAKYLYVYVSNIVHIGDGRQTYTTEDVLNNLQIEIGNSETEYEPYKEEIYSIYLDEPLGKNDYIDFKTGTIVRNGIQEEIQLPEIYLNEDISNIVIDTEIKPSKIELEYYK